jgi:hypothetical protein
MWLTEQFPVAGQEHHPLPAFVRRCDLTGFEHRNLRHSGELTSLISRASESPFWRAFLREREELARSHIRHHDITVGRDGYVDRHPEQLAVSDTELKIRQHCSPLQLFSSLPSKTGAIIDRDVPPSSLRPT